MLRGVIPESRMRTLEPKVEQKLRMVAEILGVDLNAAIAVCIAVHHPG